MPKTTEIKQSESRITQKIVKFYRTQEEFKQIDFKKLAADINSRWVLVCSRDMSFADVIDQVLRKEFIFKEKA